jgi:hypothetical protein
MELSKRERRFAEISVKRYHGLLCRTSHLWEWVGTILFSMGLLRILTRLEWNHYLLRAGFTF